VFEATHKKQRPWVNSCLMQDVVLVRAWKMNREHT
jgi:hypothetical protein